MHPLLSRSLPEKPRRLVVTSWGAPKAGKSHFALTFPSPIVYLNLDFGVADLQWKFPETEVWRADFPVPKLSNIAGCADLLTQLDEVLDQSCRDLQERGGGTVVIDTASLLWQLVQKVDLQPHKEAKASKSNKDPEAVKVMQFQYADANLRMSSLLRRVIPCEDVNAVFIHGQSDVYDAGGNPTGAVQAHGWKAVHGVSQFTLQHYRRDGQFFAKFEVCRPNPDLERIEVANPTYDTFREFFLD